MNPTEVVRRIRQIDDPGEAFRTLVVLISERYPVLAARWRSNEIGGSWPEEPESTRLLAGAPDAGHLLVVPIGPGPGELRILLAPAAPPLEWEDLERLGQALGEVIGRRRSRPKAAAERDELRRRLEESEALHVLGLAANRTLEPDEVLTLVARSARSLLGAHYATVSTHVGHELRIVAAVGLRGTGSAPDPLAELVLAAGRPLIVDEQDGPSVRELPLHEEQEMRAGIGVPLALFGDIFGALVIGYRRPYPLEPRDTRLALTLAGHAAVAISNARLHRALADRGRELEHANEELRGAAAAKERFFASMSHELRTPIHSVLGYHDLILGGMAGELPERARTFLGNAQRATEALRVVIDDVLDLSKLDAGKMEITLRSVDPVVTLAEAIDTVRPLADRKGLEIRSSVPAGVHPITTDPDRLRQILVNLLSNGIKFTDEGYVMVEVAEEQLSAPAAPAWLLIRIRDSGPGISPIDGDRIFHEFEQVAGADSISGTGLGLPISRRLARLLGGDLLLESDVPNGASFLLRLPVDHFRKGASIA